ncbi:MAG TPA: hypothetical protein VFC54_01860 [Pseudolabrys sp.]|nr:hypothetical protein [Pseudolabrys sp.]
MASEFRVPPRGHHVWWMGMPIFTFEGSKARDLFVLDGIYGLIGRLKVTPWTPPARRPCNLRLLRLYR